ncbi:hypothetical protein FQN57_005197 [Myotisia sp. PD_48]|nr:hypothetical protein FQN57_005197 [Myotisia sp. PD_48]
MSFPKPPVDLKDHCSVLHKNTLYVYTPKAFLSLPLKEKAKWKKLSMGKSVTGGACFKGGIDGNPHNPAFYIIGGETDSDSESYIGIQRYSFASETWQSIPKEQTSGVVDLKNRVNHAATYINSSASILVYAGSQNRDPNPSTQSFVLSHSFHITAHNSYVPPAFDPWLVPWSEDKAAMVGGGPGNTKIFTFSAADGWQDTGAQLPGPLGDKSGTQVAMISGADGSKILEVYDFTVSPTAIRRYVIMKPDGTPGQTGQQVGIPNNNNNNNSKPRAIPSTILRKRGVAISDYPEYNGKHAPKGTRKGMSLAQDSGLVVFSGGDTETPIVIFDQNKNEWLDINNVFGLSANIMSASETATSSSIPTNTMTSEFSTTMSPTNVESTPAETITASSPPNTRTLTIIGATLGAILGLAAILIIILLLLAWRRRRYPYGKNNKKENADDKDRLSFQDQGMEPLTRFVQPMGRGPVPSTDSWAIVSGNVDKDRMHERDDAIRTVGNNHLPLEKGRSPLRNVETTQTNHSHAGNRGFGATVHTVPSEGRLTDEGWGKYFQGDNDTSRDNRSTVSSLESKSDYRGSGWPHTSAEVPPLNIGRIGETQELGQVSTGSPSTEHPAPWDNYLVAQQGMSAKISSGDSISVCSDDNNERNNDAFSSGVPESIREGDGWMTDKGRRFAGERVPSSNYSNSVYQTRDSHLHPPGSSDRPLTQWPADHDSRANLSSDISWLNIGKGK